MKHNLFLFVASAGVGLCGCAGKPPVQPAIAAQSADGAIVLRALPDASVPKGECGMILWTLDETRPAAVFRYVAGKTAEIVIANAPVVLTRTDAGGASAFGVFESQTFADQSGLRVKIDVRFSLGFDGGTYLERGLVAVESPDGWRMVAPAAGLAGCRAR